MTASWQRLRRLFDEALAQPASERERFVAMACDGDAEMRRELQELLAADAAPDSLLDEPPSGSLRRFLDAGELPRQIGPYRVEARIGRGGMSTVYLAQRVDPELQQRVAIKVIRRELDSGEMQKRLRQERQILASFDHPSIARLLDGGRTEDGLPYVVMEYVEGLPLDRYCRQHRLGLQQRLRLFQKVCQAVHYAHQNLVVHRDLKPGNVLVTSDGVPKLLDFGIAKLLRPELSQAELISTRPEQSPMTLAYASPEQIRGEPITTASDIYSLGVLLYELLTGESPYPFSSREPRQIEHMICEEAPIPPSRQGDISIPPDLDAIVLKAMHLEPGGRYSSAEQLSEDLERFLTHLPVLARLPTWRYRVSRWLRRNRLVAVLGALLLASSLTMAVQTWRLSHALERAREQQAETARERNRSEQVLKLLIELFEVADPEQRGEISAREILDRGARRLSRELVDEPQIRATLLDSLGRVYQNLGLFDVAEKLLEEALELRREHLPPHHPEIADSLDHLGFLNQLLGRLDLAESLNREALAIRLEVYGERHLVTATSQHHLAETLFVRGRYDEAEALYRQALALRRELLGADHRAVAESLSELGLMFSESGRAAEAVPLLEQAVSLWRSQLGPDHLKLADGLENLASAYRHLEDWEAAERMFRQALDLRSKIQGASHPALAIPWWGLGYALHGQKRLDEAEDALRRALAYSEATGNTNSPMLGTILNDLGLVLKDQGKSAGATELLRRAVEIYRASLGPEHPAYSVALTNLARAHRLDGDLERAEKLFRTALELRQQHEPGSFALALSHFELGRVWREQGRVAEAEPLLRASWARLHELEHPVWAAASAGQLGASLVALGDVEEGRELLSASRETLRTAGEDWGDELRVVEDVLAGTPARPFD